MKGSIIILLIYVDDILIGSNYVDAMNEFKLFLDNKFKLKDLGTLKYFLGLEVHLRVALRSSYAGLQTLKCFHGAICQIVWCKWWWY